jgi:hypothetical protein
MCNTRLAIPLSFDISAGSSLSFWFCLLERSTAATQAIVTFHSFVVTVDRDAFSINDCAVTDLALRE